MTFSFSVSSTDWLGITPLVLLVMMALIVMLVDLLLPHEGERTKHSGPANFAILPLVSIAGILLSLVSAVILFGTSRPATVFNHMLGADNGTLYADLLILVAGGLGVLLSPAYLKRLHLVHQGEYYALMLFAMVGMMLMASATSFLIVFVGLEMFSLSLYILCSFVEHRRASQESGMKYFLLSSFASAFLLYGIALVYAATGSTAFETIQHFLRNYTQAPTLLLVGMGLLTVGFSFKVSAVPFQTWTPDVYEGAPAPVTAFMSVGTKVAALLAFVRVFGFVFSTVQSSWMPVIWAIAVLTMVAGNVMALTQSNVKRMLAYSSIAHGGYLLTGIVVSAQSQQHVGATAILLYLTCYLFMNTGAFGIISLLERENNTGYQVNNLRGLWYRCPWVAALLALFLISLAGFPPLAGFAGKYYIFYAALVGGHPELLIIGVLASVLGIYYYLRVVATMFMEGSDSAEKATVPVTPAPALVQPVTVSAPAESLAAVPVRSAASVAVVERPAAPAQVDEALPVVPVASDDRHNNPGLLWPSWLAIGISALGTLVVGVILPFWLPNLQQAALSLLK
jgi:proton-translocating NADH-quinone oxidoreductase, chain N